MALQEMFEARLEPVMAPVAKNIVGDIDFQVYFRSYTECLVCIQSLLLVYRAWHLACERSTIFGVGSAWTGLCQPLSCHKFARLATVPIYLTFWVIAQQVLCSVE